MAEQIFDYYKGQEVTFFIVLVGAFQFFFDLNESIKTVRAVRKPVSDEEDVIVKY